MMTIQRINVMMTSCALVIAMAPDAHAAVECRTPAAGLKALPGVTEASGLAISRVTAGRFWTHNDSGEPVLFALDAQGNVAGRWPVGGARVEDWEAIATGPCAEGNCVFVGDIGDNDAKRTRVTVYRIAEPRQPDSPAARAVALQGAYPDGAHDAEAMFVTPEGRIYIVTKGETGASALYAFPRSAQAGTVHRLERIGSPRSANAVGPAERITDAAMSPDGKWVVVRTTTALSWHPAADLLAGKWQAATRIDLKGLKEPQGEGVALANDGTVYLAGEGGEESRSGTFARLQCRL